MRRERSGLRWWAALGAIALASLVARTWNLDHDQRQHLHPDERHWSLTSAELDRAPLPPAHGTVAGPLLDWLDGQRSPANPYRGTDTFVYGGTPLAVARAASGWLEEGARTGAQPASATVHALDAVGVPLLDEDGAARFDDGYQVDLVGRLLGAIVDTAAVVVVARIARRVRGDAAGLLAAALAGSAVLALGHTRILGAEPWLHLTAALVVLATLRLADDGPRRALVARGLLAGLAAGALVAAKLSGAGLATVPFLAAGALLARRRGRDDLWRLVAVGVGSALAFRVLQPAAFDGLGLGPSATFWEDQRRARELTGLDLPPAIQWSARIPVLEPLRWLLQFTLGPGIVLAATAGAIAIWRRPGRGERFAASVLSASVLVPFLLVVRGSVTTGRYFVPLLPAACVLGGIGIDALWRARHRLGGWAGRAAPAAAVGLVAIALLWGVAFTHGVHGHPHTRIEASRWIGANVPAGSVISAQAWDDALPLAVDGVEPTRYEAEQLDLFAPDTAPKAKQLAEQLVRIDYVVESSPRVWAAVARVPARYPSTSELFDGLDDGRLGFERAATFTSPPRLGPWRLDEGAAEEAFTVYDHPEVRIWRKVRDLPADELLAALDPAAADRGLPVVPTAAAANGLLLRQEEVRANRSIGTYREVFDVDGPVWAHVLGWVLIVEALGAAAFVLLAPWLRTLPDAGAGLARVVGLAGPAFATFVAVAWLGVPYDRWLVGAVAVAWVGGAALVARRRRAMLLALWRERRRTIVLAEVVGLAALVAVLALRAANPDLWHPYRGGEKPFELEMLTAVLRTRTLPPYDPWWSGGSMNYHYGTYLLLSTPARLLATAPALAMQLGLAVVAAMSAGAVFSAGAAASSLGGARRPVAEVGRRARRAGVAAIVALLVVPNAAIVPSIVGRLRGTERGVLDWWGLSRTRPGTPIVTEFPAWSYLFGDLHPHLTGTALLATLGCMVLAWTRTAVADDPGWRRPIWLAALVGLLVGWLRATNTWDLPLGAALGGIGACAALVRGTPWRRVATSAVAAAGIAIVGWAPYWWRGEVTDGGLERVVDPTPLGEWLAHWGAFAVASGAVVAALLAVWPDRPDRRPVRLGIGAVAGVALVGAAVPEQAVLAVVAALAVALTVAAVGLARDDAPPVPPLGLALAALGWLGVAGLELVSVANDFERQNSVFKGWYQAWLLIAVGLSVVVVALAASRADGRTGRVHRGTGRVLVVAGALLAVAFWQLAPPARLDDRLSARSPSLDGLAYLDAGLELEYRSIAFEPGDDRPLIDWLQRNGRGLDVVAEAVGEDYSWSGRISVHTGLPTPLGWSYHQSQQRRRYDVERSRRELDLRTLYETDDPAAIRRILRRYDVRFVVYGTIERTQSNGRNRAALLDEACASVAFGGGDAFILEVDQACMRREPDSLPLVE